VQNWNDGKTQEYKDRKVYDIENSSLRGTVAPVVKEEACECAPAVNTADAQVILVSRVTCPNCRVAESLLGKAGVAYEKKIAEENLELCREYGIKGAPTLIVTDGENYQSYYGVPEIKKYLATL
ncbi:MAG: ribonucleoside triphosphate reductase, partial [Clostridia bacterium]|nr:ribonucleoside triphosphate reductase [Clostridia bacterium]